MPRWRAGSQGSAKCSSPEVSDHVDVNVVVIVVVVIDVNGDVELDGQL
jgi:hypothetical protein